MTKFEDDITYDGSGRYAVITCSAVGCDVHVRYDPRARTRPRYCRMHTLERGLRGVDEDSDDLRKKMW